MYPKQDPLRAHTRTVHMHTHMHACPQSMPTGMPTSKQAHMHAHSHACMHTKHAHRHAHRQAGTHACTHVHTQLSCGCISNGLGAPLANRGVAHGVSRYTGFCPAPASWSPPHGVWVSFPPATGSSRLLMSLPQRGPRQPILSPEEMRRPRVFLAASYSLSDERDPHLPPPSCPPPAGCLSGPGSSRSGAPHSPARLCGWSVSPGLHRTHLCVTARYSCGSDWFHVCRVHWPQNLGEDSHVTLHLTSAQLLAHSGSPLCVLSEW